MTPTADVSADILVRKAFFFWIRRLSGRLLGRLHEAFAAYEEVRPFEMTCIKAQARIFAVTLAILHWLGSSLSRSWGGDSLPLRAIEYHSRQ